ncbi:MAG: helix-turn-helix transcriptional regulator, partial [Bacteroides sp.]|nr:helix-turn-helix transcriptional regulator [Bacteroides sp.]
MENPIQNPVRHQEFSVLLQKDKAPDGVENLMSPEQSERKGENKRLEDEIYKNVIYQLEVKKIYLDPNLSLTKLSSIVGTNTTYLSNTVNRRFGMNLKALVNRYRVGHAKALMKGLKQRADIGE